MATDLVTPVLLLTVLTTATSQAISGPCQRCHDPALTLKTIAATGRPVCHPCHHPLKSVAAQMPSLMKTTPRGVRGRRWRNGGGQLPGQNQLMAALAFLLISGIALLIWVSSSPRRWIRPSSRQGDKRSSAVSLGDYKGSSEYQAMLARNGGVAPGRRIPDDEERKGTRGGRYTRATSRSGRRYRKYF